MIKANQPTHPTIKAVVIRKDGRIEDHGVICGKWWQVLLSRIKLKVKELR